MSDTGDRTFETVRARYKDWFGGGPRRLPGRDVHEGAEYWEETDASGGEMSRMVMMGIGAALGLALLGLAGLSFATAAAWDDYARDGAFLGYMLVGIFLTIAGLGAILATWYHNFRVVGGPAAHH
jgi:hypothetical protein